MVYYLIGSQKKFPNLKLLLWNQPDQVSKIFYGTLRLHGQLELRVDDWVDYGDNGETLDNRVIEMGWNFKTNSTEKYDGFKAKFLYNSTYINNPSQLAFQRIFQLNDVFAPRL